MNKWNIFEKFEHTDIIKSIGNDFRRKWIMSKKKKEPFDPKNIKPEDKLKFEIATELGLADKVIEGGWRSLTSKESGRIGGLVTKRKREIAEKNTLNENV